MESGAPTDPCIVPHCITPTSCAGTLTSRNPAYDMNGWEEWVAAHARTVCLQAAVVTVSGAATVLCILPLTPMLALCLQGAVVNVSSVAAIMPMGSPMMTSYGVAKAAQDTLTKNLAFEFATKGVRVNSVLPGTPVLAAPQSIYFAARGALSVPSRCMHTSVESRLSDAAPAPSTLEHNVMS